MSEVQTEEEPWRKVFDFPLVALLIALILVFICLIIAVFVGQFLLPAIPGLFEQANFEIAAIPLLILGYELVIRHLGKHPRDDYRDRLAPRNLAFGLAVGFVIFSVVTAVAALLGVYRVTGEGNASDLLHATIESALFAAISEELIFRGIIFRWVEEFGGSWAALAGSSAAFGAIHLTNPNSSPIAAVGIALEAGILLGAAYMLTRSLWMPMGIHAAWNFAEGEVYDIPVSGMPVHGLLDARVNGPPLLTGNGFGLEASVIGITVGTISGLLLLWLAIRRGQVVPPPWTRRRELSADSRFGPESA